MMKLLKRINNSKKNGAYAGDLETSTAYILFAYNIKIMAIINYIMNLTKHIDSDIINILFINNKLSQRKL